MAYGSHLASSLPDHPPGFLPGRIPTAADVGGRHVAGGTHRV